MRTTRIRIGVAIILTFALAIAAPAGALAQSAGDEQYVDPFQGGGGSGGDGGEGDSGSQPGAEQDPNTGDTGADTGSTPVSPSTPAESTTGTAAGSGAVLPVTGLPLAVAFSAGLLLLGSGFMLRRRA